MIINLLSDYRGVLTEEEYYTAGKYIVPDQLPQSYAKNLLEAGRAVEVEQPKARSSNRTTKSKGRRRKAG